MDFFDAIKEKLNIVTIISIAFNVLLVIGLGIIGFMYVNYECPSECKNDDVLSSLMSEDVESVKTNKDFYVEIKGQVVTPGVYLVNDNYIINDVILMAGGLTKNAYTNNINLSKKVTEELVIYIYSKTEYKKLTDTNKKVVISECVCPNYDIQDCVDAGSSTIIDESKQEDVKNDQTIIINPSEEKSENNDSVVDNEFSNESKLININTASVSELMTLNGIGESKAKAIIEYRQQSPFTKVDDIKNVSGIGDAAFEKIKNNITV